MRVKAVEKPTQPPTWANVPVGGACRLAEFAHAWYLRLESGRAVNLTTGGTTDILASTKVIIFTDMTLS